MLTPRDCLINHMMRDLAPTHRETTAMELWRIANVNDDMPHISQQAWADAITALVVEGLVTEAGSRIQINRAKVIESREQTDGQPTLF